MKNYISLSGGVESTTMCLLYGKGSTAIWADTGAEHSLMYERINFLEKFFIQYHNQDFELIRVKGKIKIKGNYVDNLESAVIQQKYMPSHRSRYCTRAFKIEPIDNYLKIQGDVSLMIGLNLDEENNRVGNHQTLINVKYSYPLIEDGYTRSDCEEILNKHGLHPNFPIYMKRGGCKFCYFKSKKEYKALYYLNKKEFNEVLEFELAYQDKRTKAFTIHSSGISMIDLKKECEQEMFQEEIYEMYMNKNYEEKSCGLFCHR